MPTAGDAKGVGGRSGKEGDDGKKRRGGTYKKLPREAVYSGEVPDRASGKKRGAGDIGDLTQAGGKRQKDEVAMVVDSVHEKEEAGLADQSRENQ